MSAHTLLVAKGENPLELLLPFANRHGLIAGATGTGKTVSLRVLAEGLSAAGVPVFMADIKGDLSGLAAAGAENPKFAARAAELGAEDFAFENRPVLFWDVFGENGHPLRASVSEMGPLLLARILNLNEVQAGVLQVAFKAADDEGLLLLDLKDLRALLQHVAENAADYSARYGNVGASSVAAIQRSLLAIEAEGGERFFGEPAVAIADLMRVDDDGRGAISVLAAEKLHMQPRLYATFLLWLLSELYEALPEVGDVEKPKLVFFFDEAHLLFADAPKALVGKVEQVVRLIRSKGVGVWFCTQSPLDVPESVLGQLGNRVQHALRAFTPKDQKAVKTAAQTFRARPGLDAAAAITELAVGEALVSFLDAKGTPVPVERAKVLPPRSRLTPLDAAERRRSLEASPIYGKYEDAHDRESAFEKLQAAKAAPAEGGGGLAGALGSIFGGGTSAPARGRGTRAAPKTMGEQLATSIARSVTSSIGRQIGTAIVRGVLGSILKR
jgi:DNA helicase HerA-like ATPase